MSLLWSNKTISQYQITGILQQILNLMPRSLSEAKIQLAIALEEQKMLQKKIKELRQYINTFEEKPDLDKRNREIYARFKEGESLLDLAAHWGISKARVKYICDRCSFQEKKKG